MAAVLVREGDAVLDEKHEDERLDPQTEDGVKVHFTHREAVASSRVASDAHDS